MALKSRTLRFFGFLNDWVRVVARLPHFSLPVAPIANMVLALGSRSSVLYGEALRSKDCSLFWLPSMLPSILPPVLVYLLFLRLLALLAALLFSSSAANTLECAANIHSRAYRTSPTFASPFGIPNAIYSCTTSAVTVVLSSVTPVAPLPLLPLPIGPFPTRLI